MLAEARELHSSVPLGSAMHTFSRQLGSDMNKSPLWNGHITPVELGPDWKTFFFAPVGAQGYLCRSVYLLYFAFVIFPRCLNFMAVNKSPTLSAFRVSFFAARSVHTASSRKPWCVCTFIRFLELVLCLLPAREVNEVIMVKEIRKYAYNKKANSD